MASPFLDRVHDILTVLSLDLEIHYLVQNLLLAEIVEDRSINTAATNGTTLLINPDWFMGLEGNDEKAKFNHQMFVILHEGLHIAFMDLEASVGLNHRVFNYAADYANNAYIHHKVSKVKYPMDAGYLYEPKYAGMTATQIYDDLMKNVKEVELPDNVLDEDIQELDPDTISSQIAKVRNTVATAAANTMASGVGDVPDHVKDKLNDIYHPKMDWQTVLLTSVSSQLNKDDFSFMKPKMAFLDSDFIMPSLYSESVGHIAFARDSSASMDNRQLELIHGALVDIKQVCDPECMEIITFTTKIHQAVKFLRDEPLRHMDERVRGGTYIEPIFDHLKDSEVEMLVVFSDMLFRFPPEQPPYPVIWINTGSYRPTKIPYGEHIICNH